MRSLIHAALIAALALVSGAHAAELGYRDPTPVSLYDPDHPDYVYPSGVIIVKTREHALYYTLDDNQAIRYTVGVGRDGFKWQGQAVITAKKLDPDWHAPKEMLKRQPKIPAFVKGGDPMNPLGKAALYIGQSEYRIHGSYERDTLGTDVSSGCIRMANKDIIGLYDSVQVGTPVVVSLK